MKAKYSFLLILNLCLLSFFCSGQDTLVTKTEVQKDSQTALRAWQGFDFFNSEELLDIKLCFDIKRFLKTKSNPEYVDAVLTIKTNPFDSLSQPVKIKARGFMRLSYCSFPPIMLKFKTQDQDSAPIQRTGMLKLVTHCNPSPTNENYVLKEYLVYKLYNLLTPYSFRTRLVRVSYTDNQGVKKPFTEYGFLIENEVQMAERNNAVSRPNINVSQKNMNPQDMARVALFNYLIGNTDWALPNQHNIKILQSLNPSYAGKGIPVVYDFDYSGFVNTSYATPAEELPIKNVTERLYLGVCMEDADVRPVLEEFEQLKDNFMHTIDDFKYLPQSYKKQAEAYINGFYKSYNNDDVMLNCLDRTCKRF